MTIFKVKFGVAAIMILLLVSAVALTTRAQDKIADKREDSASQKKERVHIDGDHMKMNGSEGNRLYTITGNVVVKYQDVTMTSDKAVYTEKDGIVVAEGNLKIVDPETDITGTKCTAYLNDRKTIIQDNVTLIVKPKPSDTTKTAASVQKKYGEPATMTCDTLEYLYKKKIATAEGNIKVVTESKRTLTAKNAVYDINAQLVTLTGGFSATDEKGQTLTSPGTAKASLKDGDEWVEVDNGTASIDVDLDKETTNGTDKPAEAPKK